MLKHIVMWRLKEQAEGSGKATNAALLKERLETLRGRIPGLLAIEVGIDVSGDAEASDVILYSEFADRAALEGYQEHPEHVAIKPFVKAIRIERRVVDYEV